MLAGKKIIIGITGSIAAYKVPLIVRQLVKAGAVVKVIMTPAGTDFVSKLTLSTLSKNPVLVNLFDEQSWANHVELGRWADLMLIAPLSCNTLSKMATGQCDNLLLATYLSTVCPVMIAPAMDEDMWHHPNTKKNLETLRENGNMVLDVAHGELASGLVGQGRMIEPAEIVTAIKSFFQTAGQLKNKKALVTAGPTYEAIDPVRFIGNHSSGKMGYAIADELASRGADVTLVSGPVFIQTKNKKIKIVSVTSADEMYTTCNSNSAYDIAVMAAAVADYTPVAVADHKIKKSEGELTIILKKTKDILGSLGKAKSGDQILVGFALETENENANAQKKLVDKNADLIVLNSLKDDGAGFGHDTNKVTLFFKNGKEKQIELKSKSALAKDIVDAIIEIKS
ncbi:MAG TPA: bifunctional phosphopantothenoylcysteine decarboxylase/phosphopantothenate--cysteine ligase CoaBC [Flavisolibacter sp.]|jgi:phosphopantothenoylcysteine decarboxylase/phosphopantothenate--cysteine ligase|nr:bifunctional phosphopantothenoylcysteine decarboxylase/phosphopantothenate--cysteine ligase CoaBC [Flavisolibacter sp.]